ncbi:MAG: extracellular solute-binding protein, partial [SAR202 cluster bacterium]|nr:extracellular solute-binding protein [SAR202 cluster bacterium]
DRYDVEDFLPSCLDAHRFRSRQVSLPEKGATMLLFYNKKLFREAGLEYPTPDWTIARFAEAARRLTRRDAMGRPVQVGCLPYDATSWIWSMGGDFARGGLTELCFTQPETVRAVEFLSDLRNRWRVTTRNMDSRGRDPTAVDVFESGRVAMAVTGPWELPKYEKIQEFDWDLSLFPRGPAGRQTRYAGMGYGIWAGTRHPEASWTLLQYLVGREAMTALRGTGFTDMPTRRSVLQSVFSRQKAPFRLDLMLRSMDPADAQVRVLPQDERWPEVERLFFEELDSALIGLKSPARAMATAQARAERFLSASEYRAGAVDYAGVLLLPAVIGWLLLRRARRRSGREPD